MNAEISGGVKVFSPSRTLNDRFAAFRDPEREELQLFLYVLNAAAHQALDGIDGAIGMVDQFLPRRVADDELAALGVSDTTLGTSLSPSSPGITSGLVRFIQATRLLVVPRSIPTTVVVVVKLNLEHLSVSIRFVMYLRRFSSPRSSASASRLCAASHSANCALHLAVDLARAFHRTVSRGCKLRARIVSPPRILRAPCSARRLLPAAPAAHLSYPARRYRSLPASADSRPA